jgi:hypothetical protein
MIFSAEEINRGYEIAQRQYAAKAAAPRDGAVEKVVRARQNLIIMMQNIQDNSLTRDQTLAYIYSLGSQLDDCYVAVKRLQDTLDKNAK